MCNKIKIKEVCDLVTGLLKEDLNLAKMGITDDKENEIREVLTLWQEVKAKDYDYDLLTSQAKAEVDEALFEEED